MHKTHTHFSGLMMCFGTFPGSHLYMLFSYFGGRSNGITAKSSEHENDTWNECYVIWLFSHLSAYSLFAIWFHTIPIRLHFLSRVLPNFCKPLFVPLSHFDGNYITFTHFPLYDLPKSQPNPKENEIEFLAGRFRIKDWKHNIRKAFHFTLIATCSSMCLNFQRMLIIIAPVDWCNFFFFSTICATVASDGVSIRFPIFQRCNFSNRINFANETHIHVHAMSWRCSFPFFPSFAWEMRAQLK